VWDNLFTKIAPEMQTLEKLKWVDLRGTTFATSFVENWTKAMPNTTIKFDTPCDCLE
jgi:hypothetical protein